MTSKYFAKTLLNLFFIFYINLTPCSAQTKTLQLVPGFPSTEVYDVLTDSNGFLWIAHNGGVSKYDGINFIDYSNPLQTSPNATGLVEDKCGRIWCHNFTGQIFYIENGRMNLLKEYESSEEPNFPRIGLFKDMLVATTKKGLFICDVKTLKCHYEKCADPRCQGTSSLSIQSNQVIAYGNRHWYIFKPGSGLKLAYFNKKDTKLIEENIGTLNVETFKDTAFLFCNPGRMLYKLSGKRDSLQVCQMQRLDYFINTISVQRTSYLVNTVRRTIEYPVNRVTDGYDITSLAVDKQGRRWYGTLGKGLMTDLESESPLKDRCLIPLLNEDLVKCLIKRNDVLLIGTQNGKLISYEPKKAVAKLLLELPVKSNGISYLKMLSDDDVLVGSPTRTFVYNIPLRQTRQTFLYMSVKQADTINNSLVLATSPGLIARPIYTTKDYEAWKKIFSNRFKGFSEIHGDQFAFLGIEQRAKAICCQNSTKTIWASLKNGLYSINSSGTHLFLYNGSPVYTSCLVSYHNKVIAGTFNKGILIIAGKDVKRLTTDDGLLSDNILQLKILNDNLWVFNSGLVQVFDLKTLSIVNNYQLPNLSGGIVTDVDEIESAPYLANNRGLYKVSSTTLDDNYGTYLNSIVVNGKDTGVLKKIELNYNQNDIQVNIGVPSLSNGKDIVIKYRLNNNDGGKWSYAKAGERNFRFASLMPGNYHFEAVAGRPQTGVSGKTLKVDFVISSPWWKQWWWLTLMGLFAALIILGIARLYYLNLLANEKAEFEKQLAVEKERQRISSDMHDDIGASLSAIKLFTESLKTAGNTDNHVDEIYGMMTYLSNKVKEVIWQLDKKNDSLENLISFLETSARDLFRHSVVKIQIVLPDDINDFKVGGDQRQDIFLAVKEALHNVIKHSGAANVLVRFKINLWVLQIVIEDDGKGIPQNAGGRPQSGHGIINMKARMGKLGGEMFVETSDGTKLKFVIPLGNIFQK